MALDAEEYRRRRKSREKRRAAAQRKNRRMLVRLGIAVLVLILCGGLIAGLVHLSSRPQTDASTDPTQSAGPKTVIHLAAAGDMNITDRIIASDRGQNDYTATFMDVAHLLANADVSTINFEGTIYGTPYGTESKSAPQSLIRAMANMGIDMVQLANSYALHHGTLGLQETYNGIRAGGMNPLGVYPNQEAAAKGKGYTIREVNGVKIAFVAFTKGMYELASVPPAIDGCINLLYSDYNDAFQTVDKEGISKVLDAVSAAKPDITIALLHWGREYNDTIHSTQETIINLMRDKGVDAIIGTHPHRVQEMTYDADTGFFVAYSLGDFIRSSLEENTGSEYSVILNLEITKDNTTGQTKITGYDYVPIFTVAEEGQPLRVVRIREAMKAYEEGYIDRVSKKTYDEMAYALQRIESRISGKG